MGLPGKQRGHRLVNAVPRSGAPPAVLAGVFLLSLAGLLFQVALTRLASAALNYHLAVLAVSAGVLGTGAGATWVACWRPSDDGTPLDASGASAGPLPSSSESLTVAGGQSEKQTASAVTRPPARRRLSALAVGSAAGIATVSLGFAWVPLGNLGVPGLLAVILGAYPLLAAPYVCIGGAVALALRTWPHLAARLYGADLLGAGAGCLLAVPLMDAVGPPMAVSVAALAALGGGGLLRSDGAPSSRRGTASAPGPAWDTNHRLMGRRAERPTGSLQSGRAVVPFAAVAGAVGGAAVLAGVLWPDAPNVLPTKPLAVFLDARRFPGAARELTWWDATSRVDVFTAPGAQLLWQPLPGEPRGAGSAAGSQSVVPAGVPEMRGVTIDADALTAVVRRRPGEPLPIAGRSPSSVAYAIAPRRHVLVIGPGGGVDVAAALAHGAERVDAVEVNRGIARLMLGPLAEFSGQLFRDPAVRLVVDEGRSYLQASPQRYDAIVLTAVDSWAALAGGSYSLAESYLYTREAMATYLDHLNEGGVLAVSRWYTAPPREMQRLTAMAGAALAARGVPPESARLLLRAGDFGTLIVRQGSLPPAELSRAAEFAAANGFALQTGAAPLPDDARAQSGGDTAALPDYATDATDDRPFFFDFVSWADVLRGRIALDALPTGHAVLLVTLLQGACLGVAGVVLPHRRLPSWLGTRQRLRLGAYAASVGAGFMLAELSLVQRLTLLLGQPALSLAVSLAALLGGAGAGSALWARYAARPEASDRALEGRGVQGREVADRRSPAGEPALGRSALRPPALGAPVLLVAGAVLLSVHALLLPALWATALAWPIGGRVLLALLGLALPALCLGPALPAGGSVIGRDDPSLLPWVWGINGAASAVGAALAVMLAMTWGLRATLLLGGALYLLAAALLAGGASRPAHSGAPAPAGFVPIR